MLRFFRNRGRSKVYDPSQSEAHCLFVSSKGLMKHCEVHQPLPNDSATLWPPEPLENHRAGGRIYVHSAAFRDFVARALPLIDQPFVLVSGDFWLSVTEDEMGADAVAALLAHPMFTRWHVQNLGIEHAHIHRIPLGLDYHTITRHFRHSWGRFASPLGQEAELHKVRTEGPPLADRTPLGYSNWHFMLKNGDRADVIKTLPKAASVWQRRPMERLKTWQQNQECLFTISPRGNGMDCHRTWEGIILGSAPVIPDLPINTLFRDLPVVVVQDWAAVTPEFLARERTRILDETFEFRGVLLEHWRRELHGTFPLPELRMRYQDFMALGPDELSEIARG